MAYAPSEWCPKPYSYLVSETRALTETYVFQAFAYDQTWLLLLLAQLMPARCSCYNNMGWFARGINNTYNNISIQRNMATALPQNRLRYLTERNNLRTPNLVSESPCLFQISCNLNCSKRLYRGIYRGLLSEVIKGDARSLDYSSNTEGFDLCSSWN